MLEGGWGSDRCKFGVGGGGGGAGGAGGGCTIVALVVDLPAETARLLFLPIGYGTPFPFCVVFFWGPFSAYGGTDVVVCVCVMFAQS